MKAVSKSRNKAKAKACFDLGTIVAATEQQLALGPVAARSVGTTEQHERLNCEPTKLLIEQLYQRDEREVAVSATIISVGKLKHDTELQLEPKLAITNAAVTTLRAWRASSLASVFKRQNTRCFEHGPFLLVAPKVILCASYSVLHHERSSRWEFNSEARSLLIVPHSKAAGALANWNL